MNENNQENWLFCIDWLIHVDLFNLVFHAKKMSLGSPTYLKNLKKYHEKQTNKKKTKKVKNSTLAPPLFLDPSTLKPVVWTLHAQDALQKNEVFH